MWYLHCSSANWYFLKGRNKGNCASPSYGLVIGQNKFWLHVAVVLSIIFQFCQGSCYSSSPAQRQGSGPQYGFILCIYLLPYNILLDCTSKCIACIALTGGLLVVISLFLAWGSILPISAFIFSCCFLCMYDFVSKFLLFIGAPIISHEGLSPWSFFTWFLWKDPISK